MTGTSEDWARAIASVIKAAEEDGWRVLIIDNEHDFPELRVGRWGDDGTEVNW